jgi:DNA-binding SARP family transcriptional activator
MARLSVAVLGAPEIRHGERITGFPTRKTLALLVYLLVEGGTHRRDKLVSLFWPESDEQAGGATLRSTLARLRESLGDDKGAGHLRIERDAVAFDVASAFDLDLDVLQRAYEAARKQDRTSLAGEERQALVACLQRGAAAWRGEFLEGFLLRDAPDFDDWVGAQREVWRRRAGEVFDRLSLLQAEAGATADALETAERWLHGDPLHEPAHRRLIHLHLMAGDRGAALGAYERCRSILLDDLGVPPEPETEALGAQARLAASRLPVPPRPVTSPRAPFLDGPIVGREQEFSRMIEQYVAATRGHSRAVVLQGEAGIGKTRLAEAFLAWAEAQGGDVLQGQAFESAARLPYQPLIDALRPRLEREPDLRALLSDTWLAELARVLPELRDQLPGLPLPESDEAVGRARLFEAFARLLQVFVARAPLVLFVDDVQWGDVASLDVLRYVGRRWSQDGTPALLLLCLRSETLATTPQLVDWLQGLHRDLEVAEIELGPLSFVDTRRLLYGPGAEVHAAVDEAFARWVYQETSGQPFFVVETLRALSERGALTPRRGDDGAWVVEVRALPDPGEHGRLLPAGVRRIVQARLGPLPPAARDLLTAAAVLGQKVDFTLLCQVGRLSEDDALPALDAVVQARLLRETSDAYQESAPDHGRDRYVFAHDKIRDVVYDEAGEARRSVFHRRAMESLETTGAPAAELARHALAAGLDDLALHYCTAAGDAALSLLAPRDAAAHFGRAIALAERLGRDDLLGQLYARKGRAYVSVAMWMDARRELDAALARLPSQDQVRRAEILVDLADACFWTMDVDSMHRHASEVLDIAGKLERGDLEVKALAWLATAEGSAGNLPACVERNQAAIDRARSVNVRPPPVAFFRSMALYWLGRHTEAVAGIGEAVDVAQEANDISWTMWLLPNLGLALAGTGHYAEAARAFDQARDVGRTYGAETQLARALACSAGFRLDLCDFAGAEARSQEARELAKTLGFTPPAVSAGIDLIMNYTRRGDVEKATPLLDEVSTGVAHAAGFHGWLWSLRLAEARAEMALAYGQAEDAIRLATGAIARCRAHGRVKYEVLSLITRAEALGMSGHRREASADLHRAVAMARPVGDPALLLRAINALLPLNRDDALAEEETATLARILDALPDAAERRRFEAAWAQQVLERRARMTPRPHHA